MLGAGQRRGGVAEHERRLVDGLEHLVKGRDEGALRVPAVAVAHERLDLTPLVEHVVADEEAREEVAGDVHDERRRAGYDLARLVDLEHHADPLVDGLVRDVLRQAGVAREQERGLVHLAVAGAHRSCILAGRRPLHRAPAPVSWARCLMVTAGSRPPAVSGHVPQRRRRRLPWGLSRSWEPHATQGGSGAWPRATASTASS